MPSPFRASAEGVRVSVKLSPRSRRQGVLAILEEGQLAYLHVAVAAPPVEGAANAALLALLARIAGIPKSRAVLEQGQGSRRKVVFLVGPPDRLLENLLAAVPANA